jgi:hypothetical protein
MVFRVGVELSCLGSECGFLEWPVEVVQEVSVLYDHAIWRFSGIVHACLKYAGHPEATETVVIHTGGTSQVSMVRFNCMEAP